MNINSFINQKKFIKSLKNFNKQKPFPYVVLDNFLKKDVAIKVKKNFKNLEEKKLWSYNNFCEVKEIMYPGQNKYARYKNNSKKEISIPDIIKKDLETLIS